MSGDGLAPRDLAATGFTPALEGLVRDLSDALCATFVDAEGETIDLATRVDPFEARIAGAVLAIPLASARERFAALGFGAVAEVRAGCDARVLLARSVGDGCDLVVVLRGTGLDARCAERCAAAATSLHAESGVARSPALAVLRAVDVRVAPGGLKVPRAFDDDGRRRRVAAFLGVREEPGRTSYLVRTDQGEEVLIERDHATRHWRRV